MKIVYFHGFGSKFDPESNKIKALTDAGHNVVGVDIDYYNANFFDTALSFTLQEQPDIVMGTSLGGWLSSHIAAKCNLAFVALNPSIRPSISMRKYIGTGVDYAGNNYNLTDEHISTFVDFYTVLDGTAGVVFLESNDEVIDPLETEKTLSDRYEVIMIQGGSHRFEHIDEVTKYLNTNGNYLTDSNLFS